MSKKGDAQRWRTELVKLLDEGWTVEGITKGDHSAEVVLVAPTEEVPFDEPPDRPMTSQEFNAAWSNRSKALLKQIEKMIDERLARGR